MADDLITTPTSETPAGNPSSNPDPAPRDADAEVRKAYDKLRAAERERDELKRQAAEFEALKQRVEADEASKLSESEKLQKKLADYEAKIAAAERQQSEFERTRAETVRDYEIKLAATRPELDKDGNVKRAAFRDPADAMRFIDLDRIDFDAAGHPTNIADLLAKLAKDKPYLLDDAGEPNARPLIKPSPTGAVPLTRDEVTQQELANRRKTGMYSI